MCAELLTCNLCAARSFGCLTFFLSRIILLQMLAGSAVKVSACPGHGEQQCIEGTFVPEQR